MKLRNEYNNQLKDLKNQFEVEQQEWHLQNMNYESKNENLNNELKKLKYYYENKSKTIKANLKQKFDIQLNEKLNELEMQLTKKYDEKDEANQSQFNELKQQYDKQIDFYKNEIEKLKQKMDNEKQEMVRNHNLEIDTINKSIFYLFIKLFIYLI